MEEMLRWQSSDHESKDRDVSNAFSTEFSSYMCSRAASEAGDTGRTERKE
jgi:hypothetical protein